MDGTVGELDCDVAFGDRASGQAVGEDVLVRRERPALAFEPEEFLQGAEKG